MGHTSGQRGRTSPLHFHARTSPLPWHERTSPLDFSRLARAFPDYVCLVEIDFDSGTEYFSFEGVGTPSNWYEPYVDVIGEIQRESPIFGDAYRVGDVQIKFINNSQYFTKKKGTPASFYNRTVRILYGDIQDGAAAMIPIFTGRIYKWTADEGGFFYIQVRDFSFARFQQHVHTSMKTLTTSVFPDMPVGAEPRLVPVIYGTHDVDSEADLTTYDLGGPIPCYLIDTDAAGKWRYVVAGHVCKAVDTVFVYGVKTATGNYTVTTATYGGVSMTVIDFNSDPRQSARSSELEVTASVRGITDDGTTGGTLLTDPVDIIDHYLRNYTDTSSAEIDTASKATARTATVAAGYACAMAITQKDVPHADIIAKWCASFLGSVYVTRDSKIGIFVKTTASPPTPTVFVTADTEILENSFAVESNEVVASEIQYNWLYSYVRDFFGKQPNLTISGQSTALNSSTLNRKIELHYVRDATTALGVANSMSDLLKEAVEFQKFDVTPDQFTVIDLNGFIGLTHWQGVSAAGGYDAATVRIYAIGLQPTPTDLRIHTETVKLA